ncbi:MAG: hypothetical protein LC749_10915 [Actinobacteria bacterium]|nr:hypothetical protein [Actinomycetota bacterium]
MANTLRELVVSPEVAGRERPVRWIGGGGGRLAQIVGVAGPRAGNVGTAPHLGDITHHTDAFRGS